MGHPSTRRQKSAIPCHLLYHLLYVIRYHDTIVLLCNKNSHFRSKKTRTRTSNESTNITSFNDSGGEDCGDICNIFDFDEDDDVAGPMQSEWDEDTSTTMKKRKFKAFLTDGDLSVHFSDKLKAIACCPRKDCSCLSMLRDPDMCSALVSYLVLFERKSKYEQDSIILQWVIYRFKIPSFNGRSMDGYHVPFDGSCLDEKEWLTNKIRNHYLCVWGLQQ